MKVLIVGSGGREHAIAFACAKSPKVDKIYCAPGNAGIAQIAECVPIGAMEFDKLVDFAKSNAIDLTVIGMDDPLVGGIVDVFEKEGLRVFGPRKNAAILEGSKAFSKELMRKYNIPTAAYETFTSADDACRYLETADYPIVLKADGLALGKGVIICNTKDEAMAGVKTLMTDKQFGDAGNTIVIEEFCLLLMAIPSKSCLRHRITSVPRTVTRDSIQAAWVIFHQVRSTPRKLINSAKNIYIRQRLMP